MKRLDGRAQLLALGGRRAIDLGDPLDVVADAPALGERDQLPKIGRDLLRIEALRSGGAHTGASFLHVVIRTLGPAGTECGAAKQRNNCKTLIHEMVNTQVSPSVQGT
jgi:hypothetical protein